MRDPGFHLQRERLSSLLRGSFQSDSHKLSALSNANQTFRVCYNCNVILLLKLGGPGKSIEADESMVSFKKKTHVKKHRWPPGMWVYGMIGKYNNLLTFFIRGLRRDLICSIVLPTFCKYSVFFKCSRTFHFITKKL